MRKMEQIKLKKLVYPLIMTVVILIIAGSFIKTAQFLYNSINRTFQIDESAATSQLIELNLENLNLVAKKLGIGPITIPENTSTGINAAPDKSVSP